MLIAGMGVVAALAFVLGLGALCLYALKRWGTSVLKPRSRVPLEVVQRVSLGPKTGLAVVRVGEKVMALSVGEGGVRTLFELDESDRQKIIATSTIPLVQTSSAEATKAFSSPIGKREAISDTDRSPVSHRFMNVIAEIPRFLTDAPTTSKGALNTYTAPAHVRHSVGHTKTGNNGFDKLLALSLSNSTRIATFVLMVLLLATPELRAQASPVITPQAPAAPPQVQVPVQRPAPPQVPTAPTAPAAPTTNSAANTPANTARTAASQPQSRSAAPTAPTAPIAADEAIMRLMPQVDVQLGGNTAEGGLRLNGTVGIVVMMGLLTLLPTLLLMMTGFTRILVVLHFLKQAMGTQSAPPGHLLAGMALLLTSFVMGPTLSEVNRTAVTPWLNGEMTQVDMMKTGVQPFREFMLRQTRQADVETFVRLSRIEQPNTIDDVPLHVLMSAFVASELRTAFQIGFAIYLPFIIIDAVVASVLMSMGMFMLPPAMISLPFKLLLFVLVDGWSLTITSLIQSFR